MITKITDFEILIWAFETLFHGPVTKKLVILIILIEDNLPLPESEVYNFFRLRFEDHEALHGGSDGLTVIKSILDASQSLLKYNG